MSKSKDLAAVIRAHVDACCAEIRAEVEREFAAAIAWLGAGVRSEAAGVAKARVSRPGPRKPAPTRDRRGKSKPVRSLKVEAQPPQPAKRPAAAATAPKPAPKPHTCSECDQPGHNARTCLQRVRSADPKPPVDETRAQRFARIEAAARARTGATA